MDRKKLYTKEISDFVIRGAEFIELSGLFGVFWLVERWAADAGLVLRLPFGQGFDHVCGQFAYRDWIGGGPLEMRGFYLGEGSVTFPLPAFLCGALVDRGVADSVLLGDLGDGEFTGAIFALDCGPIRGRSWRSCHEWDDTMTGRFGKEVSETSG